MNEDFNLKKELVLERFKTLNPESKISLGRHGEVTVKEIIKHIEKGDELGRNVVKAQMKMIQVLANVQ